MARKLVLDFCRTPKFMIVGNGVPCSAQSFFELEYTDTIVDLINELEITEVSLIVQPTGISTIPEYSLGSFGKYHINANLSDINETITLCKMNGVSAVEIYSYLDYYRVLSKGVNVVIDSAVNGNLLAVLFNGNTIIDAVIGKSDEVQDVLQYWTQTQKQVIKYINAHTARLPMYPNVVNEGTFGREFSSLNALMFCLLGDCKERAVTPIAPQSTSRKVDTPKEEVVIKEEPTPNQPPEKEEPPEKVEVAKSKTKPKQKKQQRKPNKFYKDEDETYGSFEDCGDKQLYKVTKESFSNKLLFLVNIVLCLCIGVAGASITRLPGDTASLNDYASVINKQTAVLSKQIKNSYRVASSTNQESLKYSVIYDSIRNIEFDGVLASLLIKQDTLEITVYMSNIDDLSSFKENVNNLYEVKDVQNTGSVVIGETTMAKVQLYCTLFNL